MEANLSLDGLLQTILGLSDANKQWLANRLYDSIDRQNLVLQTLPDDIMLQAFDFAFQEAKKGKCIPHSSVSDLLDKKMGWQ